MVFVDTSAFHALLDANDQNHSVAGRSWISLLRTGTALLTTNYVVLESIALAQRRLGMDAVRTLREDLLPVVTIQWVTPPQHDLALQKLIAANRRKLSLVDSVSFVVMNENHSNRALAFDAHFDEHGIDCRP